MNDLPRRRNEHQAGVYRSQEERILAERAQVRDDIHVMAAMIQRMDGTLIGVVNEERADHSRSDRLSGRVRKLERDRKLETETEQPN